MTGVLFGVFRDINTLVDELNGQPVFCFDRGINRRKEVYPEYKGSRKEARDKSTDEEKEIHREFMKQVDMLRDKYLPRMGFRNILSADGYEADDVIARICMDMPPGDCATIVSSDADMWQLLVDRRVRCYNPTKKTFTTATAFRTAFGLEPSQFADVKAIAGCATDDVPGVAGVGETTAAKFIRGDLKPGKKFDDIVKASDMWKRNLQLVKLPFEGTPSFEIIDDVVTDGDWNFVVDKLGMPSLVRGRASKPKAH